MEIAKQPVTDLFRPLLRPTWSCSARREESPSSGSAGGVLIVTDFSERLSLLRDLWCSRLRSLTNTTGKTLWQHDNKNMYSTYRLRSKFHEKCFQIKWERATLCPSKSSYQSAVILLGVLCRAGILRRTFKREGFVVLGWISLSLSLCCFGLNLSLRCAGSGSLHFVSFVWLTHSLIQQRKKDGEAL